MNDAGTRVVDNEIIKGLRGRLCPSEINEWVYYDEDSEQYLPADIIVKNKIRDLFKVKLYTIRSKTK